MNSHAVVGSEPAVSLVYEGVEEAMPWQSLMDFLAQSTASYDATLHVFSPDGSPTSYYVVTSNRESYTKPEWLRQALTLAADVFPRDHEPHYIEEVISREQLQRTDIYQQILSPGKIHYILAHEVYRDDNVCIRVAIDRKPEQGPFNDQDKRLLMELSPHLIKAIRLRLKLQDQEGRIRLMEDSLSNMGIGVLSLNAAGEILDSNDHAQALLERCARLQIRNRRLCLDDCRSRRFRDVLGHSLTANLSAGATTIRVEGAGGNTDLQLVVKPLHRETLGVIAGTAAQVFISEVGARRPDFDPARLQEMFAFTAREARLAVLIAEGCALKEAADQLNVSINTIKTHLRGIYDKLGVRRQAKVATILNASMAAMM